MTADAGNNLAVFTYHNHPDGFHDVLADQLALVKFLRNPLIGTAFGAIAAKWLGNRK